MMVSIRVDDLRVGQIFPHPVYIEDDIILVPAGIAIRKKDLERLRTWKIQSVETEEALQNTTETLMSHPWALSVDERSLNFYMENIYRIGEIFTRIFNMGHVSRQEIERIVLAVSNIVDADQEAAIRLILADITTGKTYAQGALDIAILSQIIGLRLGCTRKELFQLCSAALLHDTGMQRIPCDIADLNRGLHTQEREILATHPVYSYRIVREELQFPVEVAQSVLQHHERWDGEGYPRGLKDDDIMLNSRIIAVADAFVAMISERLWRKSIIRYEAMKMIIGDSKRKFDPRIVRLIIGILGIYPVGSIVQLSDGSIGRVCGTNENAPLRPVVRILIDKAGKEFRKDTGPTIALYDDKGLFITRAVSLESLSST